MDYILRKQISLLPSPTRWHIATAGISSIGKSGTNRITRCSGSLPPTRPLTRWCFSGPAPPSIAPYRARKC